MKDEAPSEPTPKKIDDHSGCDHYSDETTQCEWERRIQALTAHLATARVVVDELLRLIDGGMLLMDVDAEAGLVLDKIEAARKWREGVGGK